MKSSGRAGRSAAFAAVGLLIIAAVVTLAVAGPASQPETAPVTPSPGAIHPARFFDERAFSRALEAASLSPVQPMSGARVAFLPHHWLAGELIMETVRDLAAADDYRRVILVGPDHVNAGAAPVTTSLLAWQTPFGQLAADTEGAASVVGSGAARRDDAALRDEHSIAGIVHAVAYYMPDAAVLPLALRSDVARSEIDSLATALAQISDSRTVMIVSTDFSHYRPLAEAARHDQETIAALRGRDDRSIRSYGNEHVDSPPALVLALHYAAALGGPVFTLRQGRNSAEFGGDPTSVTTYVTGYLTVR